MEWWFFVDGFMSYMESEFPDTMRSSFTRELLRNVINHLVNECEYQQEFVDKVMEIVPEVKEEEVTQWFNK